MLKAHGGQYTGNVLAGLALPLLPVDFGQWTQALNHDEGLVPDVLLVVKQLSGSSRLKVKAAAKPGVVLLKNNHAVLKGLRRLRDDLNLGVQRQTWASAMRGHRRVLVEDMLRRMFESPMMLKQRSCDILILILIQS